MSRPSDELVILCKSAPSNWSCLLLSGYPCATPPNIISFLRTWDHFFRPKILGSIVSSAKAVVGASFVKLSVRVVLLFAISGKA